ncbi:MAG: hypothetical protein ABIZ34_09730 [Candidatus Limnocylindrales bacterium]
MARPPEEPTVKPGDLYATDNTRAWQRLSVRPAVAPSELIYPAAGGPRSWKRTCRVGVASPPSPTSAV